MFDTTPIATDATEVTTAFTTVMTKESLGGYYGFMSFEVDNAAGGSALSDVKVQFQTHPGGSWHDYLSLTDWNDASNANIFHANLLPTVAAGSVGVAIVRHTGISAIRIQVKSAGTSTVTIRGTLTMVGG